jgi:signal transduction histidine kinase
VRLASRLSAFFLVVQALILAGFSAALCFLAAEHLSREVDEQLDAALVALVAAAEVEPGGINWEPKDRVLRLGRDSGAAHVRWALYDPSHKLIDRSADWPEFDARATMFSHDAVPRLHDRRGQAWRQKTRHLLDPHAGSSASEHHEHSSAGKVDEAGEPGYSELTFVAVAPLAPVEDTLRWLALTVFVLSLALWLAAAVVGRRLCRRALSPLTRMALAAADAEASDPAARLPVAATADELQELGTAFNGLLDRLHEALERQRRFTGDASHQLRTPLAALMSQVDVALRRERPPAEYQRVLGLVHSRADELRQIVESLLFLARAEAESALPELESVDLVPWLKSQRAAWSSHPRSRDIVWKVDDCVPVVVGAHAPLLVQLFHNLVDNACKYSPAGSAIEVRLKHESAAVVLSVEDQGDGIPDDEQIRLFEPFYRTPAARERGRAGVGLGLAVAQRIARVLGATICVRSTLGVGSCFDVVFPIGATAIAAANA